MDIPDDGVCVGPFKKKTKKEYSKVNKVSGFAKEFRKTNKIKLHVINKHCRVPPPVQNFESLSSKTWSFNPIILKNVSDLSYLTPTAVQAQAVPLMLQHRNIVVCAPTGSGKTAAYLLPLLDQFSKYTASLNENSLDDIKQHKISLFGLILAPTQELVRQIWSEAVRLSRGLTEDHFLACLGRNHYANRGKKNKKDSQHKLRELRLPRSTKILVATPSRIGFLVSLSEDECPFDLSRLSWLIVDECDKMLEVNLSSSKTSESSKPVHRRLRSFRDQLEPVLRKISYNPDEENTSKLAVALFSATVPDEVVEWCSNDLLLVLGKQKDSTVQISDCQIELVQLRIGSRNSAVPTIKQELRYCASEQGKLLEMKYLLIRGLTYPCLIFMESRDRANDLLKEILLSDSDVLANVISSNKTEAQRAAVMRAFREGQINVLICTDLLGRGIDFKGISTVINYDVPPSKNEYIHRVGRTGRAGQYGKAITLWTDSDLPHMAGILKVMRRSGSPVDAELERLVGQWKQRHSKLIAGKRIKETSDLPDGAFSRRRGERRLVHKLVKGNKNSSKRKHDVNEDESAEQTVDKKVKWLRPWNPYRGRIKDVAGSLSSRTP